MFYGRTRNKRGMECHGDAHVVGAAAEGTMSELISGKVGELLTQVQRGERITGPHIDAFLENPDQVFLEVPGNGTLQFRWREKDGQKLLDVVGGIPIHKNRIGHLVYITYGAHLGPRLSKILSPVSIVDGRPFYAGYAESDFYSLIFHGLECTMVEYPIVADASKVAGKPLFVSSGSHPLGSKVVHGTKWIGERWHTDPASPRCANGKYAFIVSHENGRCVRFNDVWGKVYDKVWGLSIVDDKPLYAASLGEMHHVVHGEVEIRVRNKVIGDPLCVDSCYWYTRERYGEQQFINPWCSPPFDEVVYATVVNGIPLHAGRNSREFTVVHGPKKYPLPGVWTAVHEVLPHEKGIKVIAQLGRSFYELVLWDE